LNVLGTDELLDVFALRTQKRTLDSVGAIAPVVKDWASQVLPSAVIHAPFGVRS